jgi:hypothetical protein
MLPLLDCPLELLETNVLSYLVLLRGHAAEVC